MRNVLLKSSTIAGSEVVQSMLSYRQWQIFVRLVAVNMRWANALGLASVISCTWSQSLVSWDVTCTLVVEDVPKIEAVRHLRLEDVRGHLEIDEVGMQELAAVEEDVGILEKGTTEVAIAEVATNGLSYAFVFIWFRK